MENKSIKQYCEEAYENAVEKGFHSEPTVIGETLMLIVSELGEALEAHRKNKFANKISRDMLSNDKDINVLWVDLFKKDIKDTFEDEIADTFIRLFDLCGNLNIDIEKFIQEKMAYNKTRPHKHGKEY